MKFYAAKDSKGKWLMGYGTVIICTSLHEICEEIRDAESVDYDRVHNYPNPTSHDREKLNRFARKLGWRAVRVQLHEVK